MLFTNEPWENQEKPNQPQIDGHEGIQNCDECPVSARNYNNVTSEASQIPLDSFFYI